jgi:hypothetical protein
LRDPELYAKGAVRHPHDNTFVLHGWTGRDGPVQPACTMRHVAFID